MSSLCGRGLHLVLENVSHWGDITVVVPTATTFIPKAKPWPCPVGLFDHGKNHNHDCFGQY